MLPRTSLCDQIRSDYPIILAPMFLVSDEEMMVAAGRSGISGCLPAHNYKSLEKFREALKSIKEKSPCGIGVNLIVNKSNIFLKSQLKVAIEENVDFIITSLGSPEEVIKEAKKKNIFVYCDVIDLIYSLKVESLGADGVIAVNSQAGGHAGNLSYKELIPDLVNKLKIPVISAGGSGDYHSIKEKLDLGAIGVSMGSVFIASKESPVSLDYKNACVEYGAEDIVLTRKISGVPCTVINTPYVKKIGTKQNFLEKFLNNHKKLKRLIKAFRFFRGSKLLEKAAFSSTYKNTWCAGPSIKYTKKIESIADIVNRLVRPQEENQDV